MPTLAELVSIPCPSTDGISFLPTLLGDNDNQKEHEYLYWEFSEISGEKAVRWGNWKGIISNIKKGNSTMQLFNLETDLTEQKDVASEHPDIVERLRTFMDEAHETPENPKFAL